MVIQELGLWHRDTNRTDLCLFRGMEIQTETTEGINREGEEGAASLLNHFISNFDVIIKP